MQLVCAPVRHWQPPLSWKVPCVINLFFCVSSPTFTRCSYHKETAAAANQEPNTSVILCSPSEHTNRTQHSSAPQFDTSHVFKVGHRRPRTRFHNDLNRDNATSNTSKLNNILEKPFYSFPKGYLMICIQFIFSLYFRITGQTVFL